MEIAMGRINEHSVVILVGGICLNRGKVEIVLS